MNLTRREFGSLAVGSLAGLILPGTSKAAAVAAVPPGAIDCHNHVVGPQTKYPMAANRTYTPPEASVSQLKALRIETGVTHNVIVQPSFYGFDNSCTLDALKELDNSARGIAVVPQDVSDAELKRLSSLGVVGVRLNFANAGIRDPKAAIDAIHSFAPRFAPLGWHIQINTELSIVAAIASIVGSLQVPVVFDHMANLEAEKGANQPGFGALVELVRAGNTYVKLSAPYNLSKRRDYADVIPIAKALIAARADRMLWGTNWPHPAAVRGLPPGEISPYQKINNPGLVRALEQECPDAAMRKVILVDTPTRLYRFAPLPRATR
jgi:predicted TIM-barrel fold metal-dependent hydrolase